MATDSEAPKREATPTSAPSSLPQKRVLEDDHVPAVSSPLNPDFKSAKSQSQDENPAMAREKRTKKESLKKRESKGAPTGGDSARATPDPKQPQKKVKHAPPAEVSPMRYKLPPPKPGDFEEARGPVFVSHHEVQGPAGEEIEFFETTEHVYNKKNFVYTHCIADPGFPSSFYYRSTEPEPHGAHMSFEDAATHMYFDKSGRHITTDKGFRMARANVAVREGRWYWECKITRGTLQEKPPAGSEQPDSHGHVRVGFARREASVDAPVGFDAYSYGIRDVSGQKVHMSRPKDFFPPGEEIREGDVLGLEIQLPSENLHRKVVQGNYNPAVDFVDEVSPNAEAPNIVRDRIPIRFKAHIYFEKIDYHTTKELDDLMNPSPMSSSGPVQSEPPNPNHPVPGLRTLPNSWIKVYKNGVLMGTAFDNLLVFLPPASKPAAQQDARDGLDDGMVGYYPAVSVFRGGAAEVNFGPKFWYPPSGYTDGQEDVEMTGQDDQPTNGQQPEGSSPGPSAISQRYDEQIVEDIVYDIIDEVDFWMKDGARIIDRTRRDEKIEAVGMTAGREEIKELVQDD
ncbi:Set1 complex component ash2 [Pleurostoma richardsiae]|uniref:Set1 complex component ash2 n=1 Tax=Pleurostoma richardsiae TaxID=41990 RepID=A0AA38R409_9PEZI|nr:Set1 complex component ash2 [Pleurostoma richardsiae]